jgi:hypothetical protein
VGDDFRDGRSSIGNVKGDGHEKQEAAERALFFILPSPATRIRRIAVFALYSGLFSAIEGKVHRNRSILNLVWTVSING